MRTHLVVSILVLALCTAVTGVLYPLLVTGIARVFLADRAQGSLVSVDGNLVGSTLLGRQIVDGAYFWCRPSATSPPYGAAPSAGSNLGPSNPALADSVRARVARLRAADPGQTAPVPVDLVTASASGLDPHITPAAALFQARRVATLRGLDVGTVEDLVRRHIEPRQFGILGEPRVNVLRLNGALDALHGDR